MSKFRSHKDAPDEVWLQIGYVDEGEHTWAPHEIAEDGIEEAGPYVRADRLSGRVTVKALEFCYGEAHCALGVYKVDSGQNGKGGREWAWALNPPDDPFYMFQHAEKADSEEAAQAAAQADFEARILAAIDTAPARDPWMIEAADDGTEIHLSGYAGGAAPGGAWSSLTLMRKRPGHPVEMRDYTADGDWSSENVPQCITGGDDDAA